MFIKYLWLGTFDGGIKAEGAAPFKTENGPDANDVFPAVLLRIPTVLRAWGSQIYNAYFNHSKKKIFES